MQFTGDLFQYDEDSRLNAFETGPKSDKTLVFIGGLGDGFNAVPFLTPLSEALAALNYSLIQVQLTSSVDGYGISSLQRDSSELDSLVDHLKSKRQKKTIVFMGHSTGSQDCYWHNRHGRTNKDVSAYILQAPVSDRHHLESSLERYDDFVKLSEKMKKDGNGQEILPREASWSPMTGDRFYSLAAKGGDDDVFSTDFTDEEIKKLYENVDKPICWIYGEEDEFYVDKFATPSDNMKRYKDLVPAIKEAHIVPGADHCITNKDSQKTFCKIVSEVLKKVDQNSF